MKKLSDKCFAFAYCSQCDEYFQDDVTMYVPIYCPNVCGLVVERNVLPDGIKLKGTLQTKGWRIAKGILNETMERDVLNETCTEEGGDDEEVRTI